MSGCLTADVRGYKTASRSLHGTGMPENRIDEHSDGGWGRDSGESSHLRRNHAHVLYSEPQKNGVFVLALFMVSGLFLFHAYVYPLMVKLFLI